MKELIALLVFICVSSISIYLRVTSIIDSKTTTLFLAFAVVSGIAIANYNVISKIKGGGVEIETAREQISQYKTEAIAAVQEEVESQKQSLRTFVRDLNLTRELLDDLHTDVTEYESKLKAYQSEVDSTKKTVSRLEVLQIIPLLSRDAREKEDAQAYRVLLLVSGDDVKEEDVRESARAEIARIKDLWTHRGFDPEKAPEMTGRSDTPFLCWIVLECPYPQLRTYAVACLAKRREQAVPWVMIQAMNTDRNLNVVRYAEDTFNHLSAREPQGVLEIREISRWWVENAEEVLKKVSPTPGFPLTTGMLSSGALPAFKLDFGWDDVEWPKYENLERDDETTNEKCQVL